MTKMNTFKSFQNRHERGMGNKISTKMKKNTIVHMNLLQQKLLFILNHN